ncbi:hypothetical protein [Lactobacillus helveticus]|uniref:hypothetical protein n=1 Tax=Lactobacillus helveticus TaxID=1587 RepID=UPI001C271C96|nr:hypothetical protein [Lactobacillus helveticus]
MFKKEGGEQAKKQKKKGRIHHGIEIPCFLRQLINKIDFKLPDRVKYNQLQRK